MLGSNKPFFLVFLVAMFLLNSAVTFGFERFPYNTRSAGMGGAFAAVAGSGINVSKNPATLATIKRQGLDFEGTNFYEGLLSGNSLSVLSPVKKLGTVAVNFKGLGSETARHQNLSAAFGTTIANFVSLGVRINQVKIFEEPNLMRASGMNTDLGVLLHLGRYFKVGAVKLNSFGSLNWADDEKEEVAGSSQLGLSFNLDEKLTIGIDINDQKELSLGIEVIQGPLAMRLGSNNYNPAFGVSCQIGKRFNISYSFIGTKIGNINLVSSQLVF